METCPHCQFLVRESSRICGVCHKPLHEESGVPAFAARRDGPEAMAAHIGAPDAGFPVSILALFVVGLLFALGVWFSSQYWL